MLHGLMKDEDDAPALLLVRDTDPKRESRRDLEQTRRQPSTPEWVTVVIGVARPKREAWVLNGFHPENEDEEKRLADLKREIGCDPRTDAHTLTASSPGAQNNAKRVLKELVDSDERERRCWIETPLSTLRTCGSDTGLAAFLKEVERRLIPLFQPGS